MPEVLVAGGAAFAPVQDTEALSFIDTPLGARKAFSNAAAQGLAITELKPQDPKAIEECMILHRYVFDIAVKSGLRVVGA